MVAATTAYRTQNAKMGCYQSGPTYRKEPRNSAISRCFWAFNYIYACIKDCVLIDPCMGSGSLLLNAKKYAFAPEYIKYYGQEQNTSTYNLARMNMFLHGIVAENQHLRNGDTLDGDWPTGEETDFNMVLMNPPYSATHGTHQDAEEGPYLLSAKNIKNGQIIIDDSSDRKISEDEFNQIHTKFTLENGDILLTIVGSIGESAILESAGKFTFQRSVAFLRPSEEMTSRFLKTEIESVQFQKELNDRKSQSAQPGVYLGDLSKIPIYITSKEEQKKIGKYFSHLDNLITLHQQKCDELRNIKKFMLQNMFI